MGTAQDSIWPEPSMPFQRTAGTMRIGITKEKHGMIKATLSEYVENQRIIWQAELPFLSGTHGFYIESGEKDETIVTHLLSVHLRWWFIPIWYFRINSIHNRIIEGILDRLENQTSHS